MPTLATEVVLANRALVLLGANEISSFDDTEDDNSVLAGTIWPQLLERTLSTYPWRCASEFAQLSRSDYSAGRWDYEYTMPADRRSNTGWKVFPSDDKLQQPTHRYEVEGNKIRTDHTELWIEYTKDLNPDDLPGYLRAHLVDALCAMFAFPVTDQQNTADMWREIAYGPKSEGGQGGSLAEARIADAQQHPDPEIPSQNFDLVNARYY